MGMDVYGKAPTTEMGRYFRNNVWWWRPLADLCQALAPEICSGCTHWHSNDGDGLDESGARALAFVLETRLADGTVARLLAERDKRIAEMPDETCDLCVGAGVRSDRLAIENGWHKGPCNACNGKGAVRPWETRYPQDEDNVRGFVAFLKTCGGFEIC
ncbi:MAG: hypothetical protein AB7E81_11605 [Hyphomicrobiaceae bacterium]